MLSSLQTYWERLRRQLGPAPVPTPFSLDDPDPTRQWRAVRGLQPFPDPALVPDLLRWLSLSDDPILRDEIAATLAAWGPAVSAEPALRALQMRSDAPTITALLDLFARMPYLNAHATILDQLDHADPLVRVAAVRALAVLAQATDRTRFEALSTDADLRIRCAACAALGQLGNTASLSVLQQRLHDADPATRQSARRAIETIEAAEAAREQASRRARRRG